mmetsp:Transcript_44260/g.134796  ORF Transcript_44260/g.134796 Transcript_44260/m.134796 type:complete len:98 (+) Transcript_44260:4042-4335(+)
MIKMKLTIVAAHIRGHHFQSLKFTRSCSNVEKLQHTSWMHTHDNEIMGKGPHVLPTHSQKSTMFTLSVIQAASVWHTAHTIKNFIAVTKFSQALFDH